MQTIKAEAIQLLKEMIAIPSPSFGEEEVSLHISSFLAQCGIAHKRLCNNIIAVNRHFKSERKTLMLCAHMDTVEPCGGYDFDPYNPEPEAAAASITANGNAAPAREDAGRLIPGLGANDDGASVVCMIAAFRHFYDADLLFNLMLVISAEEERSGADGMRLVWKTLADGVELHGAGGNVTVFRPDYAIVGEPTGMRAAVAERGLLVIDGCAEGVSGHAARGEGVNALYIALDDIQKLRNFKFTRTSPLMGDVRLSVTQINAGTAHNVIPDKCTFVVDIRPTEQYSNSGILETLQAECRSRLAARNLSNRSSATQEDSPLVKCAADIGISTFVSPTTSDWMRISCDAIKMGPGDSSRSHRKNEYVTEGEVEDGILKYIRFIDNFGK